MRIQHVLSRHWPHDKLYWMYLCNSSLEQKCLPSYLIAASRNRSSDWDRIMSHWQVESSSSTGVAGDISTSLQEVPSSKSGPRAPQSFTPGALHMNSSSCLFYTGLVKFILIPHDSPPVSTFQKSFLLGLFSSDSVRKLLHGFQVPQWISRSWSVLQGSVQSLRVRTAFYLRIFRMEPKPSTVCAY